MKVTLCGSARFEQEFHYWNKRFTLRGLVVYSLAVFPSYTGNKDWYSEEEKETLDFAHLAKIQASDAIFVITQEVGEDGSMSKDRAYVGKSTQREIKYAQFMGKQVWIDYRGDDLGKWRIPPK